MVLKIGDTVEFEGRMGVVLMVGRIGIPNALTIRWSDTGKIHVYFDKDECNNITKV
jgi:hypothetical protein